MQTGHIPAYTSPTSYNKQSQDFCIQKDRKYKRLQKLKSWMLPMLGLKVVEKKLLERITKNSSQNDLSLLEIFPPSFHSSFDVLDNEHLPWLGRISEACVHLYLHKRPQEEKKILPRLFVWKMIFLNLSCCTKTVHTWRVIFVHMSPLANNGCWKIVTYLLN